MVYETTNDLQNKIIVMRSYGWRQCRLSPGNSNESVTSLGIFPLNARTIQVFNLKYFLFFKQEKINLLS